MSDTRIAADITVCAVDLDPADLDQLTTAIEAAVAPWKADVSVDSREYETGE